MDVLANINAQCMRIFANGHVEVGLEVGADPGLSPENYVQIPQSMVTHYWIRIYDPAQPVIADYNSALNAGLTPALGEDEALDDVIATSATVLAGADDAQYPGWIRVAADNTDAVIVLHNGRPYWFQEDASVVEGGYDVDDIGWRVFEYVKPRLTQADLRAFYTLNIAALGLGNAETRVINWALTTRLASVLIGSATPVRVGSKEAIVVPNPAPNAIAAGSDDWMTLVSRPDSLSDAITALVARTASWKKTNHCVGGPVATGFARRYLEKNEMWARAQRGAGNQDEVRRQNEAYTTAFYRATHAASVHHVLATTIRGDSHHFSVVDPRCGYAAQFDVLPSAMVRIAPRSQVSGTAVVIDAVTVLKSVARENLLPLLGNAHQINALVNAAVSIGGPLNAEPNAAPAGFGMRAAVYARWFFKYHPGAVAAERFDQKDPTFYPLAAELGVIATTLYAMGSIGRSAALANAATQGADELTRANWGALAAQRRQLNVTDLVRVAGRLAGAAFGGLGARIRDGDHQVVGEINQLNTRVAAILGNAQAPQVTAEALFGQGQVAAAGGAADGAVAAA